MEWISYLIGYFTSFIKALKCFFFDWKIFLLLSLRYFCIHMTALSVHCWCAYVCASLLQIYIYIHMCIISVMLIMLVIFLMPASEKSVKRMLPLDFLSFSLLNATRWCQGFEEIYSLWFEWINAFSIQIKVCMSLRLEWFIEASRRPIISPDSDADVQ